MHVYNLWNAMTDHGEIISRRDREANCLFEAVLIQDRAHVEIVSHNQTGEAHLFAQQSSHDAMGRCRGRSFRLETWIPAVASHHAIDDIGRTAHRSVLSNKGAKHGKLFFV